MARYRTYTVEFKRQVVGEHLGAGTSLNQLARRHDLSRELLRLWVRKYEAGEFAGDGPNTADRYGFREIMGRWPRGMSRANGCVPAHR